MSNFLFFGVLRALGRGSAIRAWMTVMLRTLSIVTLLLGGYALYLVLANGFREGMPTELVLLAILSILISAVTIVAAAQIFWYRSNSAREIPDGPFIAIPVFAVLVRAVGEVYAAVIAALGLIACIGIWIARGEGGRPSMRLPGFDLPNPTLFENSFFQGLLILVLVLLAAIAYLLLFYFFAEAIVVTADIAVNVRALVRGGSATAAAALPPQAPYSLPQPQYGPPQPQYAPPQYGPPQTPPYAAPAAPPAIGLRCPNCGTDVQPGAPFCGRCGTALAPPTT